MTRFGPAAQPDWQPSLDPAKPHGDDIVRVVRGRPTGFVGRVMGVFSDHLSLFGNYPGLMLAHCVDVAPTDVEIVSRKEPVRVPRRYRHGR